MTVPCCSFRCQEWTTRPLSPDGSRLYVASFDPPTMTVYDVATGRSLPSASVPGTWGLDISPDGSLLAAAGGNDIVILDATTFEELTD